MSIDFVAEFCKHENLKKIIEKIIKKTKKKVKAVGQMKNGLRNITLGLRT